MEEQIQVGHKVEISSNGGNRKWRVLFITEHHEPGTCTIKDVNGKEMRTIHEFELERA